MKNDTELDFIGLPLVVIVAEKHPILRASLAALLSHDGYRVFGAENLKATVSFINGIDDVAVLFLDLDMPGWRSVLQHAPNTARDAYVIAMAGVEPIPKLSDLQQSGVHACLQKPLVYSDVRQAISETIGRRRAA
jgi:DNA-binding NtrC family response regulator